MRHKDKNPSENRAILAKIRHDELVSGKVQSVLWGSIKQNMLLKLI